MKGQEMDKSGFIAKFVGITVTVNKTTCRVPLANIRQICAHKLKSFRTVMTNF